MFDPEDDDITLSELAGIEIGLAADGTLKFAESMRIGETFAFSLGLLRPVALDPLCCVPTEQTQYWFYNDIARRKNRDRILSTGLRFGLTVLHPHPIGKERAKTIGQRHTHSTTKTLDYPEICEVISGSAWFVFQTLDLEKRSASFCAVLQANPGDKVIIPPNLYYVTINAGDRPLLYSNVIAGGAQRIQQPLLTIGGAAWLNLVEEGWVKNPVYQQVAALNWWSPTAYPDLGITPNRPLYQNLVQSPESLLWLAEPMSFPDVFPDIWDGITELMQDK